MPILFLVLALFFPRLVVLALYFLTDWFAAAFDSFLWPLLGFIFAPVTLVWYAVVQAYFGGVWSTVAIVGIVIAVAIDFGLVGSGRKK